MVKYIIKIALFVNLPKTNLSVNTFKVDIYYIMLLNIYIIFTLCLLFKIVLIIGTIIYHETMRIISKYG